MPSLFDDGVALMVPLPLIADRARGLDTADGALDVVIVDRDQVGLRYSSNGTCFGTGLQPVRMMQPDASAN